MRIFNLELVSLPTMDKLMIMAKFYFNQEVSLTKEKAQDTEFNIYRQWHFASANGEPLGYIDTIIGK